jgi:hypothetical protein
MFKKYHTVLFIFLFSAGVYLLTISPTVNWRDTPELPNVSYTLGIAHPAGFPTYSLAARLFTMLPFGSMAFRTNLFSLFFAAISIVLIYLLSNELLIFLNDGKEKESIYLTSIISSAFLFVNTICWQNSLISEVYTFNMFFTILLIYLLVRFSITKEDSFLYSASFLYGIASGNHATVAFYLPALILFYFLESKEKRFAKFILVCTFFLVGFSVYLYLPLRSLTNPSYDWSNPESLSQFIIHITDRKTSQYHFAGFKDYESTIKNLYNYLISLNKNITIIGIALSITGAVYLFKKKRSLFYLIFLILISNTIFFFDWNGGVQLPSYICYIIFIALGMFYVFELWSSKNIINGKLKLNKLVIYLVLTVLLILGINNYFKLNKSHIYTGEDDFKKSFLKLPEKSMVILSYMYFHYKYYQDMLGLKRDVALLGYGEILNPKLFNAINNDTGKKIKTVDYNTQLSNTTKVREFINLNINSYDRIFTEIVSEFKGMDKFIKYYDGMLFEFSREKIENLNNEELANIHKYFNSVIFRFIFENDYRNDDEAAFVYIENFVNIINYLLRYNYLDNVLYMVDTIFKVFGSEFRDDFLDNEKRNLKVLAGVAYIKKRDFKSAEDIFIGMIENNEHKSEAYNKLAFIYKYKKEYDKAINYYKLAIEEAPFILENYVELGGIYESLKKYDKADAIYNQGMRFLFKDERDVLKSKIEYLNNK